MKRSTLALTTATATAAVVGGVTLALAQADPGAPDMSPTGPPQLSTPCPASFDEALTALPKEAGDPPNAKNLLQCSGGQWTTYRGEYPTADRWLSTGTELVLRGQGMRNPELMAGRWTGSPQSTESSCGAEYTEVVSGKASDPRTVTADPGQQLSFDAPENLLNVTLTGDCLWQRDA